MVILGFHQSKKVSKIFGLFLVRDCARILENSWRLVKLSLSFSNRSKCNSILRKLRSKNPNFHPDEKKNQWSYSSRRPVNHKMARGSNRGFEHRAWNMLRILPYKWHRRTYIQGHDNHRHVSVLPWREQFLGYFKLSNGNNPRTIMFITWQWRFRHVVYTEC